MATAKKLPSGSWRCQVYSHSELVCESGKPVIDPQTGKQKVKRIYESFTSGNPTRAGKREAERLALEWQMDRKKPSDHPKSVLLGDAIDEYITSREAIKRSPTTIQEYRCTRKYAFQDLMDVNIYDLTPKTLQEAVNKEAMRPSLGRNRTRTISPKRLKNEWGLISSVLSKYRPDFVFIPELPEVAERVPELIPAETVLKIVKGSKIELAVLLAAWLSFSMSEIRGLTKSKSLSRDGDYIRINEVVVDVDGKPVRKSIGKNKYRNRTHRIPGYIKSLIDNVEGDILVPMSGRIVYQEWIRLLDKNNLPHMTFHDLRHLNASVMALLRIPDKYAQERGGWKSDKVMKRIYTQTFQEERVKVDDKIDDYFESLLADGSYTPPTLPDEFIKLINESNSDEWYDALIKFMQHEMQHKNKKA